MKVFCKFSVFAVFTMLFALQAGAQGTLVHPKSATAGTSAPLQHNPAQIAEAPVRALPIADFKLLAPNTGWVSTGSQLLMTKDNGAHWKDISPPNPNADSLASVFFHNAETGWVLFDHQIEEGENPTPKSPENDQLLYVSATTDGGATWTKEDLPEWEGLSGLGGSGIITFADKLHGWLSMDAGGTMMSAGSVLLATKDGGRSWVLTKGEIEGFVSALLPLTEKDVWVIDRPEGQSELDVTRDGGESFQAVVIPAPKEFSSFGYPEYSLPAFTDSRTGYVAVTYSDSVASKSVAVMYSTRDGGRTWKHDRVLSNLVEGETVKSTVVGSAWVLPFAPPGKRPALVKLQPNDKTAAEPHKNSGDFNNCKLDLLTEDEGWMNCSGEISSTIDGGKSLTSIAPRVRNRTLTTDPVTPVKKGIIEMKVVPLSENRKVSPMTDAASAAASFGGGLGSGIDQHLGFDLLEYMPPADMKKWWDSSPYYDAILYIAGAPSRPGVERFNAAWVTAITAEGWGLIPTWVGYQSYSACKNDVAYPACSRYGKQISPFPGTMEAQTVCKKIVQVKGPGKYDPLLDTAWNQGICQADDAIGKLQKLGFDGTIAYLDVEGFVPSASQTIKGQNYPCLASVQAYVGGWVQEMHAKGALAGVYGSASNITEAFGPENPDEIWIAGGKTGVTVWNQGHHIDDSFWPYKQRIHQYTNPTKANPGIEIWGGSKPYQIDHDIIDATIVPGSGYKSLMNLSYASDNNYLTAISNEVFVNGKLQNGMGISGSDVVFANGTTITPTFTYNGVSGGAGLTGISNLGQAVANYDVLAHDVFVPGGGVLFNPSTSAVPPPSYTGTMIDFPGTQTDGGWTQLWSINDAGWIVGSYSVGQWGIQHCALWMPTADRKSYSVTSFDLPGYAPSSDDPYAQFETCTGINGLGQIVGSIGTPIPAANYETNISYAAFQGEVVNGVPTNFSPIGDLSLYPNAINNNGLIAGFAGIEMWDRTGQYGFLINGDEPVGLSIPAADSSYISGLNDDPQILGGWSNAISGEDFILSLPQ